MNANDRLDIALKCQICFMCLTPGHITRECSNPVKCQEKRCGQRHATMLHDADWEGLRRASKEKRDAKARSLGTNSLGSEGHHVSSSHHVMGNKVALPFLLVNVTSPETGISVKMPYWIVGLMSRYVKTDYYSCSRPAGELRECL